MMQSSNAIPKKSAVIMALLAVYLLWGSTYYAIKIALEQYPPFLLTAIRMLIAGLVMYIILRWRGQASPSRAQWKNIAVLAVFMTVLSNALINFAEQTVATGLVAIGVAVMPLWAGVFSALKGQHPTKREWIGIMIGLAGVIWLNIGTPINISWHGVLAVLIAPIAWAYGSIWSRSNDMPPPFMSAATQMLVGSVMSFVVAVLLGERIEALPSIEPTAAMLYLVVAGSIFGFTAYIWLLHHVRPALATSYAYVNPVIAVLLGAGLLKETFNVHAIGAMVLILSGVLLMTSTKNNQQKRS
jgi:drug/metabolite transporter (DMT)-like permease